MILNSIAIICVSISLFFTNRKISELYRWSKEITDRVNEMPIPDNVVKLTLRTDAERADYYWKLYTAEKCKNVKLTKQMEHMR